MTKQRRPPRRLPVVAVGDQIVIREGSTFWRSESGQGVIDFTTDPRANRTVPFARKAAAVAAPPADWTAEEWYDLACELEHSSPRQARDAYESALELDPGHAGARVNLGRLLHEDGHPLAAANHYRLALTARPDDAIAADPAAADAHFNLAGLYEREGQTAGAIRHLKAYRKLTQGR